MLFFVTLSLVCFGLIMVYNASVVDAFRDFGNKYHYFQLQLRWAIVGIIAMLILSRVNPKSWKSVAVVLYLISLFLLLIVLIPGVGSKYLGARRWIGVGNIVIQPAEAAKFSLVIYLAALLSKKRALTPVLASIAIFVGLIMLEPDLGTSVVLVGTGVGIYFAAGGSLKNLFIAIPAIGALALLLILLSPYRRNRLMTYFNPHDDPQGSSYHIRQVMIALGSGGLTGVGLGQSRQKYEYLPEVTTDSIFAVVGEELGLIGTSTLCIAFILLISSAIQIALATPDEFSKLLVIGMICWISTQTLVNLGAMVAVFPLTGVPLPLISYGGSSLVVALASIGVILSVARKNK